VTGRRFPHRVYGVGAEPDPRFTLANERTFLAWIRTSLALLAGAAAVTSFDLPWPGWVRLTVGVVLGLTGLLCVVTAWWGWMRIERALRTGAPLPGASSYVVVMAGVSLVALLVTAATVWDMLG
jgi:putative membrane protein